jgi:hypothetical protein
MPSLADIADALHAAWCAETAQDASAWSIANAAAGQCWQSAYVVRHYLGGERLSLRKSCRGARQCKDMHGTDCLAGRRSI